MKGGRLGGTHHVRISHCPKNTFSKFRFAPICLWCSRSYSSSVSPVSASAPSVCSSRGTAGAPFSRAAAAAASSAKPSADVDRDARSGDADADARRERLRLRLRGGPPEVDGCAGACARRGADWVSARRTSEASSHSSKRLSWCW